MTPKILISGGCVLTLGTKTPNLTRGDVLIDDGIIAEVGPALRARDAEVVDAADTIVMPGFVDTHRHVSRSLFRNFGAGVPAGASLPEAIEDRYLAEDVYAATLIGLLGAAEAGITTVVDWSSGRLDDGFAEAALQAHADAGLRGVFVHPSDRLNDVGGGTPMTPQLATHLRSAAGPLTGIAFGSVLSGADELDRVAGEWASARDLGLRIHAHAASGVSGRGLVAAAHRRGLLGADVTLVHRSASDDADIEAIAASGSCVSLSPAAEMASGRGSPPIQQLIDADIRPGLGVDDECVTPGDLFAQMREMISLQHATVFDLELAGKAGLPRLLNTRDVLKYGTFDGARVAGLGGVIGSLEQGMDADLILLRTDRPNVFPINDPIGAVVWGMDTSNVDAVFVGGRALMRDGVLDADVQRARDLATAARDRVAAAAGLIAGLATGRPA